MKKLLNIIAVIPKDDEEENKQQSSGIFGDLTKLSERNDSYYPSDILNEKPAKKRGRPKKDSSDISSDTVVLNTEKKEKTPLNSNMSYNKTYEVPKQLLAQSMMQVDGMLTKVNEDIDIVRNLKFSKNKYDYLNSLYAATTSLIGNRISIARELSNIQSNVNRYELAKHKELSAIDAESDDKRLMDLYNAYVNAPIGTLPANIAAQRFNMPAQNINLPQNAIPVITSESSGIIGPNGEETGYANYINNLTPEQNAMVNENNPFIQTVLVYDQSSQNKWFEVIDTRTGAQVPNMPIPPDFVKENCTIDIKNGLARNSSLNQTYKLKVVGTRMFDEF